MIVTENQLDEWVRGNAEVAQGVIVELIWRLVAASSAKPKERRFPLADSVGQHGPDGILDVVLGFEPFVPDGRSLWEIGTGVKARDKATSDYTELVNTVPETVRLDSTFVFVTPLSGRRDWEYTWKEEAQVKWVEERRKQNTWKDVRVIDGTKLNDWVRQFPPVELWLARRIIGSSVEHVETPEQHWSLLRSIGEPPPLTPDVFLVNRDEACTRLEAVFSGTTAQLKLGTHFPDHVVDFVSAYLANLDDESRADAAGRCLLISGIDAWNGMVAQREKHVLVADSTLDLNGDAGTKLIQKARKSGHSVIFGGPPGGIPDPASTPLPTPRSHQLKEALEKAGYTEERARTLAQKSGGNLGSLLRCLQNLSLMPEWAEGSAAAELAISVALGAWVETLAADRAVVENVSGNLYGEWIGKMREITLRPGTPLTQHDGIWKFIARYEGWYALGPRLFDEHLDRLRKAAIFVLEENDPQFDLPKEERYAAAWHEKVFAHSRPLRNGLAESLALLGSHPRALTSCSGGKAEAEAAVAVRRILAGADWLRWASLNDLLPLLAEAAPKEFLDAVENGLNSHLCPFDQVFAQEGDGVTGRTYMSGLLWALETMAWDADHLSRVLVCLGELAARDPGGQWGNRPAHSLTTILLPWLPQTCASVAKRGAAVTTLLRELPEIGWKLLVSLLPQHYSSSSGSRRPAWRETIPEDWSKGVTPSEYLEQVRLYSELAINAAINSLDKFAELVDHLENLPPPASAQILAHLGSANVVTMPEVDRVAIWNKLVDLVRKHRKFSDAVWAMKPDQVDKIAALADRLAPGTPAFLYQRLFSERVSGLFEEKGNYSEQLKEIEDRRQKAVIEIARGGTQTVLDFAASVQSPWRVGIAFGVVAGYEDDGAILPRLLDSEQKSLKQFVAGFVSSRFHTRGWVWVDNTDTKLWAPGQVGEFLSFFPFAPGTWERSRRLLGQDESAYWNRTSANPYEAEGENLPPAIDQLIRYGRPNAAIRCLYRMLTDKQPLDNARAVRALLADVQVPEDVKSMDAYEITEVIKALQNDPGANPDDLFHVEWVCLPFLDQLHDASPKFLGRRLANEPGFFCEVIRLVFRSDKEEQPAEEPTENTKRMASNAYRLLSEWRTPPGCREDGSYDGGALVAWLEAVKRECSETGHLYIAMSMVGHVLVHVPADPDGLWIHRSAAAALNAKDAGVMREGFRTELFNLRGGHWVDPSGKPEMELSDKYRAQGETVEAAGYHRLATTLRDLAGWYKSEAEKISSGNLFDV